MIVAGGIGLAPLRPALYRLMAEREKYRKIVLLYGTRTPEDMLYRHELEQWRGKFDLEIQVTVDRAASTWRGNVGVVTTMIPRAPFDPSNTLAMVCGPEVMMRFTVMELLKRGVAAGAHLPVGGAQHEMRHRLLRPLPVRPDVYLQGRPGISLQPHRGHSRQVGDLTWPLRKPKLAVWKFSSCDGCQLSLLDCEDELLAVADAVEIANFPEASRAVVKGPYDLSLVEGSITTPHDAERIHGIRRASKFLVTIGACATAGGIQALRNFKDVKEFISIVYARPDYIETLKKSTPITDHVFVDFELRGCPINKHQLVEVLSAFLNGRKPNTPPHSVCVECKLRGTVCVMVAHGTPCLGPVTQAGCGALCPAYARGCYGCFGPKETPNTASLSAWWSETGGERATI